MVITSLDNAKILDAAKLRDKKYRNATGKYLIEGVRLVNDALKYGAEIVEVFVRESDEANFCYDNQTVVSDRVFAKLSDTVSTQGVIAVAKKTAMAFSNPVGNCLVLDQLQDPGNVGTLIRTAVACGFTDIYAVSCVDLYSPKVLRSAMSAHFCINLHEDQDIEQVFASLADTTTVAADMNGVNVFETDFSTQVALIVGNEGNGLSKYSRSHVKKTVSLPMANNFESLNVAVAGSVIMYQIYSKYSK